MLNVRETVFDTSSTQRHLIQISPKVQEETDSNIIVLQQTIW